MNRRAPLQNVIEVLILKDKVRSEDTSSLYFLPILTARRSTASVTAFNLMSSDQVLSAHAFFWLALAVVIAVLIYLLSPILTPFY
jgi:hypothetical protein